MRRSLLAAVTGAGLLASLLAGCSADDGPKPIRPVAPTSTTPATEPSASSSGVGSSGAGSSQSAEPAPPARVDPDDVRVDTATAAVAHLAGVIGPRPGTSPAYFRAARWVQQRFTELGWTVERQRFPTPAGTSWGGAVPGGSSVNVVATRGDVVAGEPWLLVGAHLDTVPLAPGAEDNASGIGVLLATAEALAGRQTRLPVVLVAFGSEEPRGGSDDDHHYGSRAYVGSLTPAQRRSLRGMVALDRVGVGNVLPVGSAAPDDPLRAELERAARRVGVPVVTDDDEQSSDHWSFVRDGLPGVRLGSTPYAGYHSPQDVPSVVSPAQLGRTARTVVAWLR